MLPFFSFWLFNLNEAWHSVALILAGGMQQAAR